jgi:YHS domain-containing protein
MDPKSQEKTTTPNNLTTPYKGKKYYFCAPGCQKAFENKPELYVE